MRPALCIAVTETGGVRLETVGALMVRGNDMVRLVRTLAAARKWTAGGFRRYGAQEKNDAA